MKRRPARNTATAPTSTSGYDEQMTALSFVVSMRVMNTLTAFLATAPESCT